MFKKLLPTYYADNIFSIDPKFFLSIGVRIIISDLDNTLDGCDVLIPSPRVFALKDLLAANGIELIVISNNTSRRVSNYAALLGCRFLAAAHKPFVKRINEFIKIEKIEMVSTILVGDQLLTDSWFASRAKLKVILTEPIVKEDQFTTKFNRLIDKPLRRHFKKKKLLNNIGGIKI